MSEKNYRKALLTVKRLNRDSGGNALRGAIDSFSRQRQQSFDNPANSAQMEALALANSNSAPPQLIVAQPPEQQRNTSKDMASQATDFGSALDDGIGMLTGRDNAKASVKPQAQQSAPSAPSAAAPSQNDSTALDALKKGISGEESGGKYGILGPVQKSGDYAVGKYQIMASNIPSWTKQALGYSMTPDEFRANPQAQEDVTSHILGGYLNQYGPKGAAAMWFSGKPDVNSTARDSLGTSVPNYVANATRGMSQTQPSAAPVAPLNQPVVGDGQYRNRANDAPSPPGYKEFGRNSDGPVSQGDIPQDDSVPQAKRGGFMRKHFDDGGSAGDGSGNGAGDGNGDGDSATGFGGSVSYGGAPDGQGGIGSDAAVTGDEGGSAGGGASEAGHGAPGVSSGVGGPSGGGAASAGAGPGNSGAATGVGGAATGGGGGTASGGSGHGGTGPGGTVGGNGGPMAGSVGAVAQQQYMQALQAAMNHQAISTSGDPGVASLGVPPGVLSGVSTAVSPVTVSQLGPPAYNQAVINAINAQMRGQVGQTAPGSVGYAHAVQGYGNAGFGGGSPGQTTGGFGGNTNATGAEGVSTAGLGSGSANGAPTGGVAGVAGPGPTTVAMRGTPAQQSQQQQAAPAPAPAPQQVVGRDGVVGQSGGAGRHYRGGMVNRAEGGEVASMPTNEMIAKALQILARRKAASGGSQKNPLSGVANANAIAAGESGTPQTLQQLYGSTPGTDATNPSGNGAEFWNEWGGFFGPSGMLENDALTRGSSLYGGGSGTQAAPAPAAPITPALDGQTIGNSFGSASGNPMGQIPMASPGGNGYGGAASGAPVYQNTLNEVLGTNSPTQDQIFGFKYPVPPPSKPQPQGPVSQDQINASYGLTDGAQIGTGTDLGMFAAGGAIIMDALTRANRARKKNAGRA